MNARSVSNSVRLTAPPVSTNVRQKTPLIARRVVHDCAPLHIMVDERTGPNNALPDGPLFVGMDGGYVRGREQGWFEVIAGKSLASFHRDGRDPDPTGRCFAYVQTVDEKPRARLVDTLRNQGMQPHQQIIFLSDGAETLRRLQQNIAPEAEHVLDWFHVTMRLTVLGQMIKGA
jgi:hypothetical protein